MLFDRCGRLLIQRLFLSFFLMVLPTSVPAASTPDVSLPDAATEPLSVGGDRDILVSLQKIKASNGSLSDARTLLKRLQVEHPGSILTPRAFLIMGEILEHAVSGIRQESDSQNSLIPESSRDLWRAREDSLPGRVRDEATNALARLMFMQHLDPEARGILELGLRESREGPFAIREEILLASSFRRSGKLREADRVISKVGGHIEAASGVTDDERLAYLYEAGGISLDTGHLSEAGEYYHAAIRLSPDYAYSHPEKLYDLALYSRRLGHDRRAFSLFRDYIRRSPGGRNVPMASYRMAKLSGDLGRPESRLARLEQVVRDFPKSEAADFSRITLLNDEMKRIASEPPPSGRLNVLPPHRKSVDDKMIESSGQIVRTGAAIHSRVEAAGILVALLLSENRYDRAFKTIHRLEIEADPKSDDGRRLRGLEAGILFRRILALKGASHDREVRDLVRSYRDLIRPVLEDPRPTPMEMSSFSREGDVLLRIARAYGGSKEDDRSRRWFRRVLAHGGLEARSEALRGLVSLDRKDNRVSAAWERGQELISLIQPGNAKQAKWILEEETIAQELGDPDREIPLLRRFVRDFPADPKAGWGEVRLFEIYRGRNEFEQAENSARKALVLLAPGSSDQKSLLKLLYRFGEMEASLHRTRQAVALWETFLRDGPTDQRRGWVMYQIGKTEEADGKNRRAYRWYLRAAKVAKSPELASVARQKAQGVSNLMNGRIGS